MITFYSMQGCPHCERTMVLLEKEISKGIVSVKPHTQAPTGVSGFPYFVSGNKTHTGAPKSKSALFQKLGVHTESYENPSCSTPWPKRDCATEPRWPGNCNFNTYGWWNAGVL